MDICTALRSDLIFFFGSSSLAVAAVVFHFYQICFDFFRCFTLRWSFLVKRVISVAAAVNKKGDLRISSQKKTQQQSKSSLKNNKNKCELVVGEVWLLIRIKIDHSSDVSISFWLRSVDLLDSTLAFFFTLLIPVLIHRFLLLIHFDNNCTAITQCSCDVQWTSSKINWLGLTRIVCANGLFLLNFVCCLCLEMQHRPFGFASCKWMKQSEREREKRGER